MSDDELSNNIPELKRLIINQYNEISEKDKVCLMLPGRNVP
jgi:hypothetical protein